MGRHNYVEADTKKQSPILPIVGFVIILAVGGLGFWISPRVVTWLKTAKFALLGGLLPVLPIQFPKDWSPLASQLAVTAVLFLFIFTLVMTVMFFAMGKSTQGEMDVNLDDIRREKQKQMKGRRR